MKTFPLAALRMLPALASQDTLCQVRAARFLYERAWMYPDHSQPTISISGTGSMQLSILLLLLVTNWRLVIAYELVTVRKDKWSNKSDIYSTIKAISNHRQNQLYSETSFFHIFVTRTVADRQILRKTLITLLLRYCSSLLKTFSNMIYCTLKNVWYYYVKIIPLRINWSFG